MPKDTRMTDRKAAETLVAMRDAKPTHSSEAVNALLEMPEGPNMTHAARTLVGMRKDGYDSEATIDESTGRAVSRAGRYRKSRKSRKSRKTRKSTRRSKGRR